MKKSLLALSLGLAASLAATSAFANTGVINFEGTITSGTCPVDVINPGTGDSGNLVRMAGVAANTFTRVGEEYGGKSFVLRVKGGVGCVLQPFPAVNVAKVTFSGAPAGTNGEYFNVTRGTGDAQGIAIAIRDSSGNLISNGVQSAEYGLNADRETDLYFNATYRSLVIPVVAGTASADVRFDVAVN
jgi:type 1 fimbria pilin